MADTRKKRSKLKRKGGGLAVIYNPNTDWKLEVIPGEESERAEDVMLTKIQSRNNEPIYIINVYIIHVNRERSIPGKSIKIQ